MSQHADQNYLLQRQQMITQFYQNKQKILDHHDELTPIKPIHDPYDTITPSENQQSQKNNYSSNKQEVINPSQFIDLKKKQIMIMTVQIDENRTGVLDIFENDEPLLVAKQFCQKHGLNNKIIPVLVDNIQKNLAVALQEKQNMNSYVLNGEIKEFFIQLQLSQKQNSTLKSQILSEFNSQTNKKAAIQSKQADIFSSDICESGKSKSVKNNSVDSSQNVYDRLFKDVLKYFSQQIGKEQKNSIIIGGARQRRLIRSLEIKQINLFYLLSFQGHSRSSFRNYGHILYEKGIQRKESQIQKLEEQKRDQQSQTFSECTYHPHINEISRMIAKRSNEPIEDLLTKIGKQLVEKKEQAKLMKNQMEEQICSFRPQLNKISECIMVEKKKQVQDPEPHYENLYQDYKYKQQKLHNLEQQIFEENYPFKPKINNISEQIVEGLSFQERQEKIQQKSKEKIMAKEFQQKESESQYFRPKTGRAPGNRSLDTFASLYNHSIQQQHERARKQQEINEKIKSDQKVQTNQNSSKLVNSVTLNALSDIFDMLDSDNDGFIDGQHMDISGVSNQVLQIIGPLLLEIEEGQHNLDKHEFLESILRLLQTLSISEKHLVLFNYKKENQRSQGNLGKNKSFTFHVNLPQMRSHLVQQ